MKKRKRKKIITLFIGVIIIIYLLANKDIFTSSYANRNIVSTDLTIYFFDVGQADSILIANNDHYMLIDAGNNEDGPKLVKYLKNELHISDIEYVVGTHPHEDHIGGLDDIINNFQIQNILLPEVITTTKTYEDVLDAIASNHLNITVPEVGTPNSTFKLGEAEFEVLYTGTDDSDLNNSSIVLKMIFGNYSYLFTGDATSQVEQLLLDKNIDVDVLKVGHHGSATSTSATFLKHVTPTYAIISVGQNNSYNHPSSDTIARLEKYTNNIYMTSQLGTIKLVSNGQEINIYNFKTDTNG